MKYFIIFCTHVSTELLFSHFYVWNLTCSHISSSSSFLAVLEADLSGRVPTGQEKVTIKSLRVRKFHCESKVIKKWHVCMMPQVKSKNDICSQEMYGYGSLLVRVSLFIEYVLKVTVKIIFHHLKTVCKIYKLSILMAMRGWWRPYKILCFVVHWSGKIGI